MNAATPALLNPQECATHRLIRHQARIKAISNRLTVRHSATGTGLARQPRECSSQTGTHLASNTHTGAPETAQTSPTSHAWFKLLATLFAPLSKLKYFYLVSMDATKCVEYGYRHSVVR